VSIASSFEPSGRLTWERGGIGAIVSGVDGFGCPGTGGRLATGGADGEVV
jgi:hypothetical protein